MNDRRYYMKRNYLFEPEKDFLELLNGVIDLLNKIDDLDGIINNPSMK